MASTASPSRQSGSVLATTVPGAVQDDATRRAWYLAAIHAGDNRPVWGNPYADASTRRILMSCMCRIHAGGRNIGVVGVEITLASLQQMLLDFSQSLGGRRRALLIRPFEETAPGTGRIRTVHRVVVDTRYQRSAADWQANLEMVAIEDTAPEIAAYYRQILEGRHAPGRCHQAGAYWMAYAPLKGNNNWILVALLERRRPASAP